jgi:hypothetical protein
MRLPRLFGLSIVVVSAAALLWLWHHFASSPQSQVEVPTGDPWFADITEEVGLRFVHDAGPVGSYFMPQALGSGAAIFDADGDGLLDIYLLQSGGPDGQRNQLWRQVRGGRFEDKSAGSGLDIAGFNMGVTIGDVNNDGRPDVLVTQFRGVRLFLNNGNGTFTDVTREAGLANPAWATSAAFFDYDHDGWLDLVVVNYVDYDPTWPCTAVNGLPDYCPPKTFPGQVTRLFRNLGRAATDSPAHVRFEDVTVASGLGRLPGPGLGVLCADFDGDGWADIFVANDGQPNRLWLNRHDRTFAEEANRRGLAYNGMGQAEAGMGVAQGDVDGDGLFDLFVTHLTEESNTLWRQGPRGIFNDRTATFGLKGAHWRGTGFGTILADFDHDGALDLALVNGRVSRGPAANPSLGPHWSLYAERNQLFANRGDHFQDISLANAAFSGTPNVARGLACADFNGDGALDLLVTTIGGPARLYRNIAPNRGHWLLVRAVESTPLGNWRDAYGAEVRVRAGEQKWVRFTHSASSYLCYSDPQAHFGLGETTALEVIEVVWPDGKIETFPGCDVDRPLTLHKGKGKPVRKSEVKP